VALTTQPERAAVEAYIKDVERRLSARTTEGPEALLAAPLRTLVRTLAEIRERPASDLLDEAVESGIGVPRSPTCSNARPSNGPQPRRGSRLTIRACAVQTPVEPQRGLIPRFAGVFCTCPAQTKSLVIAFDIDALSLRVLQRPLLAPSRSCATAP
jgi:hypothetical protein